MAKKLAYNYTFDASAQTITISGYYTLRKLVLITNVTDGTIIYNFADAGAGGTVSYNSRSDETTISLAYNTTLMSDSDELQILIEDGQDTKIDAGESLIDPVHKFRVSNPENLIDTDFEYGLQSSKWETLELVNNIPSVYSSDSAVSISGILSINTLSSSDSVSVKTSVPHGLSVGDPIEVRGTSSRTAEGKYLITAVPSTTEFRYRATENQPYNADIKTVYTVVIPGSFFTGADIKYEPELGIETDGLNPSTLTVTTETSHGLSTTTSLYITNSVGKQEFTISNNTASFAPDGQRYVDTADDSIYLPGHNLYTGQRIYIQAGSGGALPNTLTGAPTPSGSESCASCYAAVTTALDGIVSNLESTNRNGKVWLRSNTGTPFYNNYWNGYSSSSLYPGQSKGGRHNIFFGEYDNSNHVIGLRNSGNSTANYNLNMQNYSAATLFTGTPVNIGQSYFRSGTGWSGSPSTMTGHAWWCSTPFQDNTFVDYIATIEQYTLPANGVSLSQFDYAYQQRFGNNTYRNYDAIDQNNIFTTTLGDGWQYTWMVTDYSPHSYNTSYNWMGYIWMDIFLENTNWTGYVSGSHTWSYRFWNSMYALDHFSYSYKGPQWRIGVLIPYMGAPSPNTFAASNADNYTYQQVADTICGNVALTLGAPSFTAGQNTVQAVVQTGDRIRLKGDAVGSSEFDFTSNGTAPIEIETDQVVGVLDNYYTVTGTTADTLTIAGQNQFAPRVLEFDHTTEVVTYNSEYYIKITGGHGIQDLQKLTYTNTAGGTIFGLTSGTDYWAIVVDSEHLQLASSYNNARSRVNANFSASAGTSTLTVKSINGTVAGVGLITVASQESTVVTGEDTKFTTTFNPGDTFITESTGQTVNNFTRRTIESVVSDTELKLENPLGYPLTQANYFVETKIHVRADGEFLHRPFDGGVDITAGKSPNSSIVRQTRKYFRYQSGKGIQCSMAINFNPARPIRSAQGSGPNITMTTEYPHGLVAGNTVKITGVEEIKNLSPTTASYDPVTGYLTVTLPGTTGMTVGEEVSLVEESFIFTCALDGYSTTHPYPRASDPAGGNARLPVIALPSATSFVVDVGTSTYAGAHQISSINSYAVKHYDTSNAYNGTHTITSSTDFTFSYTSGINVYTTSPSGFMEYAISGYKNAGLRAGLFDYQNGFFYEYDGKDLHCVRRSSVQQLSGTATVNNGSNVIYGTNTYFQKQLQDNDMIVIRGQSYKVVDIPSNGVLHVQPAYRGSTTRGCVITRTVDTRVKQSNFNIDPVDGTGISGYNLDINKIQMAYMDYSWYGAGKIRFGFKDTYGHVKYVHEFVHNNKLNEAYMRTGNVPARYEAYNDGIPSFVPSLFHWGTSVIMDGGFDDDDSYLFTASGNPLTFTNGDADTATTTAASTLRSTGYGSRRTWYVRLTFATTDASKFSAGTPMWSANTGGLSGEVVDSTAYGGTGIFVDVKVGTGFYAPAIYPSVPSGTVVNIGAEAVGTTDVDLASNIPLISVRLAPSADNNLIGELGERDIINRMQLKMKELGISVSHDTNVSLILNGNLSNLNYQNVGSPSLTQYVAHEAGDTITGGITIYSFRASGGSEDANGKRLVASEFFDISALVDLGNSILGGNGVFPDGPDIITVACNVINTAEIDSTSAFQVASRISWAESQA